MDYTKSPHLLFRRILDILDDLRRDSIKALNSPAQRKALGLTVRQGSAISQLRLMLEDEPQGVALKDLAKRMQMTVPAASLMVDSMVSKGFMERNTNPADRRSCLDEGVVNVTALQLFFVLIGDISVDTASATL